MRRVKPAFGRAWIVRKDERWYARFECDREVSPSAARQSGVVRIDRGVHVLAASSDDKTVAKRLFSSQSCMSGSRTSDGTHSIRFPDAS
jgi:transposase